MTGKQAVDQVIESGIKPIILDLQKVKTFSGEVAGIRTSLTVKSLELGVLTANEYRFVARRTVQGNKLVERNIEKLFYFYNEIKKENSSAKFFSVSVYARSLLDGELNQMLGKYLSTYPHVNPEDICLELSADILFEDLVSYKAELKKIKERGFKVALCEVGEEYCPLLRLKEIEYDVVFLDGYIIKSNQNGERANETAGVIEIIKARPTKIYASSIHPLDITVCENMGIDGYSLSEDDALEEKVWRIGDK